ncbi:hypothetical protein TSUD_350030 [Trifolium subterraneum]|uniref:Uncharacterized protein n=1 Tax=Trifolium subterraneum TaxID=3900 RepID=A0A2Z6PFY4_TRISU|nr:hypothetical protein TSUD_350030 [Trifolium subterraneum]
MVVWLNLVSDAARNDFFNVNLAQWVKNNEGHLDNFIPPAKSSLVIKKQIMWRLQWLCRECKRSLIIKIMSIVSGGLLRRLAYNSKTVVRIEESFPNLLLVVCWRVEDCSHRREK